MPIRVYVYRMGFYLFLSLVFFNRRSLQMKDSRLLAVLFEGNVLREFLYAGLHLRSMRLIAYNESKGREPILYYIICGYN